MHLRTEYDHIIQTGFALRTHFADYAAFDRSERHHRDADECHENVTDQTGHRVPPVEQETAPERFEQHREHDPDHPEVGAGMRFEYSPCIADACESQHHAHTKHHLSCNRSHNASLAVSLADLTSAYSSGPVRRPDDSRAIRTIRKCLPGEAWLHGSRGFGVPEQGLDANGTNRYVISCLQIALRRAERHVDADGTPKTFFLYEGGLL